MKRHIVSPAWFPASVLAAALAVVPPVALSEEAHAHREHGPHEHGVGSLTLVVEGNVAEIELESPAVNIVGFEHAPKDEAERTTLERAVATLKDGGRLFGFPTAAGCRLTESLVSSSLLGDEPEAEVDHEDHQAHDDAQATQTPHEDGDHDAEHEHETHADLDADYRFECDDAARIDRVEVRLFEAFPGTQRLRVQFATAKGQGGAELTAARPRIELDQQ
jgi:hypothetical protein